MAHLTFFFHYLLLLNFLSIVIHYKREFVRPEPRLMKTLVITMSKEKVNTIRKRVNENIRKHIYRYR
jgi:hypothetical protein